MLQQETSQNTYNDLVVEAVDETLSLLGCEAKAMVYLHMNVRLKITKQDIPNRFYEFMAEIEKILGKGAKPFEEQLLRLLQSKTKLAFSR